MDISDTIIARSDQQNYDDYIQGPKVLTVSKVTAGNAEQPVSIELVEYPGRPYKPSKSMRRVLVKAWGPDASTYVGRRLKIAGNPDIKYGGIAVGGLEIVAMSHIDREFTMALTVTRGKKKKHTVHPLPDLPPAITVQDVEQCTDVDLLRSWWGTASDDVKAAITARANQLADLVAAADTSDGELVQGELIDDEVQS